MPARLKSANLLHQPAELRIGAIYTYLPSCGRRRWRIYFCNGAKMEPGRYTACNS